MIVKCEQCQTKFKIPDDKVTDKGVKVRCTKCGNTFRVTREGQQVATGQFPAAAPTHVGPPPSSQAPTHVGPPPTAGGPPPAESDPFAKFGVAPDVADSQATRPGVYALGVEASKVPHLDMSQASTTRGAPAFQPVPPRGPPVKTVGAKPSTMSQPFDFANFAPTVPEMPAPPAAAYPTNTAVPAVGTQPHRQAQSSATANPTLPGGPSPFDFGGLGPPPPGPAPSEAQTFVPTKAAQAQGGGGFDFSALVPQSGGGEAFDFGSLPPPPPGPQPQPPPPTSAPAAAPEPATMPPASTANPVSDLLGDLPPLDLDMGGLGSAPSPQSSAPMGEDVDFSDGPASSMNTSDSRAALFDMPVPATSQMPAMEAPSATESPTQPPGAKPSAKVPLAKLKLTAAPAPVGSTRRRTVVGILVNIVLALVLVAAILAVGAITLNDGVLESSLFSVERLKAVTGPQAQFVAVDISNGLYDTRAGRPVFFVRGEVVNRGTLPTRLKVRAELLDGDTLVRAGEVIAGAEPTLEELHAVTSSDELTALLQKRAAKAPAVAAGASADFLVAFFEYPSDLKSFRVRVSVSRDAEATTRK